MANENLNAARKAKNDEFYTQFADIEKEMNAYLDYDDEVFRDKVVLLPCDDPEWSNFTKYFAQNFERLGLRKLISTSYAPNSKPTSAFLNPTLFELDDPEYDKVKSVENGKIFTLDRDINGDNKTDVDDLQWKYLDGNGDFQSEEVTALRDEADFIVTNPPFSLFGPFLNWITEAGKKCAIIGNMNAITYKEVFPLIKSDQLWLGNGFHAGNAFFAVPEHVREYAAGVLDEETGLVKFRNVVWFTNIEHGRRHQPLALMTQADNVRFSKHKEVRGVGYRRYDNYDAIEVPFTDAIPADFPGVMGVPISFLDKYNPDQFEIVGTMASSDPNNPFRTKFYSSQEQKDAYFRRFGVHGNIPLNMSGVIDDVKVYTRIMIRHRKAMK